MLNLAAIHMLELIRVNAKAVKVSVHQCTHRALRLRITVHVSFCPDAFGAAEQVSVPEYHVRVIMNMTEHDRDLFPVHVVESARQDRAAVRTLDVVLGRPAREIGFSLCH